MNQKIPPSPSEAEYARALNANLTPLPAGADPLALFEAWFAEAKASEPNDPNAMALATVGADGLPDLRVVLLKDYDARGFTFYTNKQSAKGAELAANPRAALNFHWKSLRRQVRLRGLISAVSDEEADAYFATRARAAQIGAWASDQSRPMEGPKAFEERRAGKTAAFGDGPVPRPPHWGGYRLAPLKIEFWRDQPFRLHERLAYARSDLAGAWTSSWLYP